MNTEDTSDLADYFSEHDTDVEVDQTFQLEIHLANGTFQSELNCVDPKSTDTKFFSTCRS